MNYRLADSVSILQKDEASYLVSSRPLRMVRLNNAMLTLAEQMQSNWLTPKSDAERGVLETLAKRGLLQRKREPLRIIESLPTVSVIIPVKDRAEDLHNCLLSLQALDYPKDKLEIIVVDDGSTDETPEVAQAFGSQVISSGKVGGGPAWSRNRGAQKACGEILAFIDSDCTASTHWLMELLPVFSEDKVAAVGGWVDGMHDASALDRYEAVMSSLNLGRREMSGEAGEDTFYLPSCNLLIRNEAFTSAGGFRDSMHVGEDVDLTWRLRDAGWRIVYLPEGRVCHAHRSLLWPFMRRRFDYGTSEGLLQQLHPIRGKKMLIPPMLGTMLLFLSAALLLWSWLPLPFAAGLFLYDGVSTRLRMHRHGLHFSFVQIFLARGRAIGSLGYYLGYHLVRYYLVPALLAVALYPPFGVLVLTTLLSVGLVDHRVKKPKLSLPAFYGFYILEQLSYGSGVFWGCLKTKNFSSYRLDLNSANLTT